LSNIAVHFERFRFESVGIRLIPSQATSTAGRVYAAVDYDYDDAPAITKGQLMSNRTVQEVPVWDELRMVLDPTQLHPDNALKYVSSVSRSNFIEPRTAFCGFLMIAMDTPTANLQFDLEVTYDVILELPVLEAGSALDSVALGSAISLDILTPTLINSSPTTYGVTLADKLAKPSPLSKLKVVDSASAGSDRTLRWSGLQGYDIPPGNIVLDLAEMPHNRGTITMDGRATSAAASPNALAATNSLKPSFQIFDSLGYFLGAEDQITKNVVKAMSPGVGSFPATTGSPVEFVLKIAAKALFERFANARYLLPLLSATTKVDNPGTILGGWQVEL